MVNNMKIENERKFLLSKLPDRPWTNTFRVEQGYIHITDEEEVRIRKSIRSYTQYVLGMKIGGNQQERKEDETMINEKTFNILWNTVIRIVNKTRYIYETGIHIDEYEDGMLMAEVENRDDIPQYITELIAEEVTGNPKYYNQNLGRTV